MPRMGMPYASAVIAPLERIERDTSRRGSSISSATSFCKAGRAGLGEIPHQ